MISTLSTPSENNNQEKYKDNASVAQAYSRVYQKRSFIRHRPKAEVLDLGSWASCLFLLRFLVHQARGPNL